MSAAVAASSSDASASASPSPSPSPVASSSGPVELFIPSHTREWSPEMRTQHQQYVELHELDVVTAVLPADTSVIALPSSVSSDQIKPLLDATAAFLSSPASTDTYEARGRVIQDGDQAIVDYGRGKAWLNLDGAPNKTLKLSKQNAKVDNVVGQPYGNVWQLEKNGDLKRTNRKRGLGTALTDPMETARNNSQLYDRNESQKLTQAQIKELKAAGTDSDQLVEMLIENSATFANKTEFSQEKYIKKKKAKHASEVCLHPVSLARVAETFWERDPRKLRGMRPDTVGMILSYANVQAGTNSLVVESCSGLLLGSLLYRQQGLGHVIHAFEHNQKKTEGVKRFNFPQKIQQSLLHIPLDKVLTKSVPINTEKKEADKPTTSEASPMDTSSAVPASSPASSSSSTSTDEPTAESILANQVDVIFIATRYDPFSLLMSLWPYLRSTGRFVIYDEVLESLSTCHAKLSQGGTGADAAVNLILSETFFRNLQVLPNRTHPFVNMSASGGYILSGTKTGK